MILIGSAAARYWFSELREPKDLDFICKKNEVQIFIRQYKDMIRSSLPTKIENKYVVRLNSSLKLEFDCAENESNNILYNHTKNNYGIFNSAVCEPALLAMIKRSHLVVPINFKKHIIDYHDLLKKCDITDFHLNFCQIRRKETISRQKKYRTPSLNMTNSEFFGRSDGKVPYVYIHDDIHKVMAHFDKPVYEMMKRDFSQAKCEKDMFDDLSYEFRVKCVREEAYVIALERKIIPNIEPTNPEKAYEWALMRICTTLTSGWFRDFAIDNYFIIKNNNNFDYVGKFQQAISDGKLRKQ